MIVHTLPRCIHAMTLTSQAAVVTIEYMNILAMSELPRPGHGCVSTRVPVHGVPPPRIVQRWDGSTLTIDPIESA